MLRRVSPLIALLFLALSVGGCYRNYVDLANQGFPNRPPDHYAWTHHLFAGLVSLNDVNLNSSCPQGISYVYTKHSFVNMLLGFITAQIYAPNTVKVWCKGGRRSVSAPVDQGKLRSALDRLRRTRPRLHQQMLQDVAEVGRKQRVAAAPGHYL